MGMILKKCEEKKMNLKKKRWLSKMLKGETNYNSVKI